MRNPWFQTHEINQGPRRADNVDTVVWEVWVGSGASVNVGLAVEDAVDDTKCSISIPSTASTVGNGCNRVWLENFFVVGARLSLNGILVRSGGIADLD